MPAPVLIAGGGIAGLAAALALAQRGQSSCVFERSSSFSELGAGVQLGPNATGVLAKLGLLPAVQAIASQPQALHIRAANTGRSLSRMQLGAAMQQRHGQPRRGGDLYPAGIEPALALWRMLGNIGCCAAILTA